MSWKLFRRGDPAPAPARAEPPATDGGPITGCLVCGGRLAQPGAEAPDACTLCGGARPAAERCASGHAVCERCLSGPAADLVERTCAASEERDPVALALRLVRHPRLVLSPEDHDLLVPAVLVAAWSNVRGEAAARRARVGEARTRARPVPAAERGRDGGRGAASGAGTFVAMASAAQGGAGDEALVDRMVERAHAIIGEGDDALCLRRNALVAVLAAARFAREGLGADLPARGLSCENAGKNPSCVGVACPFNR